MNRRRFVKNASLLALMGNIDLIKDTNFMQTDLKTIRVEAISSNFEGEGLLHPFGFKGGYLTELWQTISMLQSQSGIRKIGLATQSVLYGDADLFAAHSEASGNALMYIIANRALEMVKQTPYKSPVELLDKILPPLIEEAKKISGKPDLNPNFVYNALVSVDNASWLLYAAENRFSNFDEMIPDAYKKALSHKNDKIAVMYQISYKMPMSELTDAANKGYFVFKIKTGFPGTQQEMLQKDKERLLEIHSTLKDVQTDQTPNGKVYYTMDANGRYEKKETLMAYLDYARQIGAYDYILLYEEPFPESNNENVSDIGLRIVADESIHDEADAIKRLEQGYGALVLKGIAKTLSFSMKIAKLAQERNIPCLCADLTVNPILVDWHKNLAGRLAPFPGIGMGLMETNGDMNYTRWDEMKSFHPYAGSAWMEVKNGVFELDQEFYDKSGGIFSASQHYEALIPSL
jgi:hypothetical protein